MSNPNFHSTIEDVQGILTGTFLCAIAIIPLTSLGLVTGQTAGFAILLSYTTGYSFGVIFFLVNLPFYIFAYLQMGLKFTIKTIITVSLFSLIAVIIPKYISISEIHPLLAVCLFGTASGTGLLIVFRHGSSLGGVGILALYLQDKIGFKAGWTQLIFDTALFICAAFILPIQIVAWSLLGVIIVNIVIAVNHRRDRYIAM